MIQTAIARIGFGLALCLWGRCGAAAIVNATGELIWEAGPGYRSAPVAVPPTGRTGFTLLKPAETSIGFNNRLGDATVATNRLFEIGSGVALGDIDGDGKVDIYFCSLEGENGLYRNLGNWRFADITAKAGVACSGQPSTGCVFADLDGDADLDLLVNSLGQGTREFINDGTGHFRELTDSGLFRRFGATSLALADVDGDGDLDLYVTNYRTDTFLDHPPGLKVEVRQRPDGSSTVEPRDRFVLVQAPGRVPTVIERGEPDVFYLNRGDGHFVPIPWQVGVFRNEDGDAVVEPPREWGLAVVFRDLNGDRLPDLYVCNDFIYWPDRIWLNQNGRRFQAAPRFAFRSTSLASMAADVADINRDGFDDIVVADMLNPRRQFRAWQRPDTLDGVLRWPMEDPSFRPELPRNTLHLARGDGTFAEIARLAGVSATDWTPNLLFLDVDLDGWEDLLAATGNNHDVQDADALAKMSRFGGRKPTAMRLRELAGLPRREAPGIALHNRRDLTFEDASAAWGFDVVGVAQGMALADLDNDGDLDVVLNSMNAPARLFRNESAAPRLAVRLRGAGANTRGIGAKIKVTGGPVTQTQEIMAGGRFCSADDALRVFAAGNAKELRIEVLWRGGHRSVVERARPNRLYEIDEAAASPPSPSPNTQDETRTPPLFEDVSSRLGHTHLDSPFDDFARQPLLPRKFSTLGPAVCWADVDSDGDDDLLVGGAKDGRLGVFKNDGHGGFLQWTNAPVTKANARDQTGLLVCPGPKGEPHLLMAESNWEDADTNAPLVRILALNAGADPSHPSPLWKGSRSVPGPLALADVDGDGDLDLFVGGRVVAGRYPEAATSYLFHNMAGSFKVAQTFPGFGLVSGAVFTDLDQDGDPDLALACEWDAIRLLRNEAGTFSEVTGAFGLAGYQGWWNGIAAGDFDRIAGAMARRQRAGLGLATRRQISRGFAAWLAGTGTGQGRARAAWPRLRTGTAAPSKGP